MFHWFTSNLLPTCKKKNKRMPPIRKQKVKHPVDLQCTELYIYMYAQRKMILWQFSHIVQTVLVMAK